jgi:hypothetical protein
MFQKILEKIFVILLVETMTVAKHKLTKTSLLNQNIVCSNTFVEGIKLIFREMLC